MDAFIGEIRSFPFGTIPTGWLVCDGTVVNVGQYQALFAIIGATWGGDGKLTFAVPNLKGFAVMGSGTGPGLTPRVWSKTAGTATVALTAAQLPAHGHGVLIKYPVLTTVRNNMQATPTASSSWLGKALWIDTTATPAVYTYNATTGAPDTKLEASTLSVAGNGEAHENRQPYVALDYCICYDGTYPISG